MRKRVGLPGTRAGDHQQRSNRHARAMPDAVLDGPPLFGSQLLEIGHGQPGAMGLGEQAITYPLFPFCSQLS